MSEFALIDIDGQRLAVGVHAAFGEFSRGFEDRFGHRLKVRSGFRTHEEQERLFRERYRIQSTGTGAFNDVRWWKGIRWVRVSSEGTVAVPGTSRHEAASAVDIYDTGADLGVTVEGTTRANWAKSHAHEFGFAPTGYGFGEAWHFDFEGDPALDLAALRPKRRKTMIPILAVGISNAQERVFAIAGGFKWHVRPAEMEVYRAQAAAEGNELIVLDSIPIGDLARIPNRANAVTAEQVQAILEQVGHASPVDSEAIADAINAHEDDEPA